MKYTYWSRDKLSRLLIIAGALCIYVTLEIINAFEMFYAPAASASGLWPVVSFGVFSLTSFISLAAGSLVWLYARDRHVARLFYALSIAIMVVFICLINLHANQLSYYLADAGTLLFVFLAAILSFYFPQDLFSLPSLAWREAKQFLMAM